MRMTWTMTRRPRKRQRWRKAARINARSALVGSECERGKKTSRTHRKKGKKSDNKVDEGNEEPPKKRQRKKAITTDLEGPQRAGRLRGEEPGETARRTRSA
jgi:hypothetical protein